MAGARGLKVAGRRVAVALDGAARPLSTSDLDTRVDALRQLRRQKAARDRKVRRGAALLTALAACLSLALFLFARPRDLTFTIDGRSGDTGAWIAAPADAPATIAFSDGSRLEVRPSGRVRVADVDGKGARVLLEDGTLSARVIHESDTSWTITAGPFEVHVVGTTFDADWSASREVLTITMIEGRVEVSGACLDARRSIQGTEALRLSCRGVTGPVVAAEAPTPPAALTITSSVPLPDAPTQAPSPSSVAVAAPSWRALAKKGSYDNAYALAEREGAFERAADGSGDAQELAELARLAGHPEVARRLYQGIRAGSPGTDAASLAAFQLGRMSFDSGGAERWFSTYLAERPNGALAAEALGRILELQQRGGNPGAKDTARRYLDRHPNGGHAALARSIVEP
jgi:hypothetical protein